METVRRFRVEALTIVAVHLALSGLSALGAPEPTLAINKLGRSKSRLFFASSRYFIRNWALLGPFYFGPEDLKDGKAGSIMGTACSSGSPPSPARKSPLAIRKE